MGASGWWVLPELRYREQAHSYSGSALFAPAASHTQPVGVSLLAMRPSATRMNAVLCLAYVGCQAGGCCLNYRYREQAHSYSGSALFAPAANHTQPVGVSLLAMRPSATRMNAVFCLAYVGCQAGGCCLNYRY